MTAAVTIPLAPVRARRPWKPSEQDGLVYQWVKFVGETQSEVASRLEISQPTVSRIVSRYERWLAHAQPGEEGRASHAERLRAQRWLTYERNEMILASCLRIADDVQRCADVTKQTFRRPASSHCHENEVLTQHASIDRTGVAARFLRLAHRINMDQLQLVEKEPLPPLEPLLTSDIEDEMEGSTLPPTESSRREDHDGSPPAADHRDEVEPAAQTGPAPNTDQPWSAGPTTATQLSPEPASPEAELDATSSASVNKLHNLQEAESGLSADGRSGCTPKVSTEKNSAAAYIPPSCRGWPDSHAQASPHGGRD